MGAARGWGAGCGAAVCGCLSEVENGVVGLRNEEGLAGGGHGEEGGEGIHLDGFWSCRRRGRQWGGRESFCETRDARVER